MSVELDEKHPIATKIVHSVILTAIGRVVLTGAIPFAIFLTMQIFGISEKLTEFSAIVNTKLYYMDKDIDKIKLDVNKINDRTLTRAP